MRKLIILSGFSIAFVTAVLPLFAWTQIEERAVALPRLTEQTDALEVVIPFETDLIDIAEYDRRVHMLAHTSETSSDETIQSPFKEPLLWPVTDAPYPHKGALLPFHRIVAYYGNFYSKYMGILGEFDRETVLTRLLAEVENWEKVDPETPVIPAIDYIATTAQAYPQEDGMYRARMPHEHIQRAIDYAAEIDGIVILEVQPGLADLLDEVKALEPYLTLPQVHLAIDPEFVMKYGQPPGTEVGTVDAADVNAIAEYLAGLTSEHNLSPKILIVHRFKRLMVTNADLITPLPEVQIVIDMDGRGRAEFKRNTYKRCIQNEPVQFTGFKVFYRRDILDPGSYLMDPLQILELTPQPIFIQYQ